MATDGRDIKTAQTAVVKRRKEMCPIHSGKKVSMLCDTCYKPVCTSCLASKDHKGHDFSEVEDIAQKKKKHFIQIRHLAMDKKEYYESRIQAFTKLEERCSDDRYVSEIIQKQERIISVVNQISNQLLQKTREIQKKHRRYLESARKRDEVKRDNLLVCISKYSSLDTLSDFDIAFFEEDEFTESLKDEITTPIPQDVKFLFDSDDVDEEKVESLFGNLPAMAQEYFEENDDNKRFENPTSPSQVQTAYFRFDKDIYTIRATSTETIWVLTEGLSESIYLINTENELERTVELDTNIYDIYVKPDESILVSCFESEIRQISKDGSSKVLLRTKLEGQPTCISQTSDGKFIVGFYYDEKIVQYTNSGFVLQKLESKSKEESSDAHKKPNALIRNLKKRFVTAKSEKWPKKVRPTMIKNSWKNGLIAIINHENTYVAIILDSEFEMKHRVHGDRIKYALAVDFDNNGNIFVCFRDSKNAVYVTEIDENGCPSREIYQTDESVMDMCLHDKDRLWIALQREIRSIKLL